MLFHKKNIKFELFTIVVIAIVSVLILFGGMNIHKSCKTVENQAIFNFIYLTNQAKNSLNNYFFRAEEKIENSKRIIELTINGEQINKIAPSVYKYNENNVPYVSSYLNSMVSPLLLETASKIEGTTTIFFDFDHEFLKHKDVLGVWYQDQKQKGDFTLVDNGLASSMYPEDSKELEWFYIPKRLQKGCWSQPYVDKDLKIVMITYSTPLYLYKNFFGVIGVDISLDKIKEFIYKIKVYKTGKVYLINKDNEIIFAKGYKHLTKTDAIDKNLYTFLDKVRNDINSDFKNGEAQIVESSSSESLFAVTELYNGFILVAEVPKSELYAQTNKLILFTSTSLLFAILISVLIALKAYFKIKRINNELMHKEKLIAMGIMAAGIAHEINNPLGYIKCNMDTLKKFLDKLKGFMISCEDTFGKIESREETFEDGLAEVEKLRGDLKIDYVLESLDEIINESQDGIKRVSDIVKNLKNFAKDDSLCTKTSEDLSAIVEEALVILNNKFVEDLEIKKCFAEMPPLLCNKTQLVQVIMNMIDNACHSVEEKGHDNKQIIISIYKKAKIAYIEVEDNGMGIDKDKIKKIFDTFYTTKALGYGTGLGLSIAYGIITEKHGGKILVESEKGKGTKFTIKIPY